MRPAVPQATIKCIECINLGHDKTRTCDDCKKPVLFVYITHQQIRNGNEILDRAKFKCEECIMNAQCYDCKVTYAEKYGNDSDFLINFEFSHITNQLHSKDGTRPLHRMVCYDCRVKPEENVYYSMEIVSYKTNKRTFYY